MNRKFLSVLMAVVIGSVVFTGCGASTKNNSVVENTVPSEEQGTTEEGTETVVDGTDEVNNEEQADAGYGETDPSAAQEMYYVLTDGLEFPASMNMDDTMLMDTYGIDPALLESYVAYMPLVNVSATEISVFELKDESSAEAVKAGIQKRVDSLLEQWERYLPVQYDLVKDHKIVQNGNFILFVISEHNDTIVNRFESAAIER